MGGWMDRGMNGWMDDDGGMVDGWMNEVDGGMGRWRTTEAG